MLSSWKSLLCFALFSTAHAAVIQTRVRGEESTLDRRAATTGKVQFGYFVNWAIYARNFHPDDMDTSTLTHILYGFADTDPSSGQIKLTDSFADIEKHYPDDSWSEAGNNVYGCLKRLYKIKLKQRNIKTLLSIGGWTYSQAGHFNFVTNAGARATFVSSAITLLENFGFDGIDIDFEYPTAAQKSAFTSLINELRAALDAHARKKGETVPYLVTLAVPAGPTNYVNLDLRAMNSAVDFWGLMAYDFAGSWDTKSGHQANLYGGQTGFTGDGAVSWYLNNGASANKVTLGMPIYGRAFENTAGIYQPYNGIGPGTWEAGVYDYKALPLAGAQVTEDNSTVASYSYDAGKRELVSYDTPNIVATKARYAASRGLGGSMFWELSADKKGSLSLLKTSANVFGTLDQASNHINYPGSIYDNIKNNLGQGGGTPTTSGGGSTPTGGTGKCSGVPAWSASTVFVGGQQAVYNNRLYTAKWWTQGETPGNADVWTDSGAC
ncbi:glycoside hydrolase family 18 and carbohydrate-binding module family 5 protein [Auricularia subglabra TFB-10046 SS5]|uniref:chitinase n=1 Tax=Auricularia subglabra (strain TFB-10046 / SS5) TaxID=717982 RepID=J0DD70_AURST|nr:glycoside hydrolase family 18 and carbohydrate-binding module family 5 protein [Auricularia subglabra TFB-10046 SS5]